MIRYKSYFLEGKKQALQLLQSKLPDIAEYNLIINRLNQIDPTSPQNKYLELLTKAFIGFHIQLSSNGLKSERTNLNAFIERLNDFDVKELLDDIENRKLKVDSKKVTDLVTLVDNLHSAVATKTKSTQKSGLAKLKDGRDYIEIPLGAKQTRAFIPLDHKTSKILASIYVGNCVGEWCTAQNSSTYWDQYIYHKRGILVYVDNGVTKQAGYFYADKETAEFFDEKDRSINSIFYEDTITKYVYKNWDKIRKRLEK